MANPKTLEELNKKYGIKGTTTTTNKNNKGKQNTSASPKGSTKNNTTSNNDSKSTLEELNKKYGVKGNYAPKTQQKDSPTSKKNNVVSSLIKTNAKKKYSDYNTQTKNIYTSTKDKLNTKTTIKSDLSESERKARIKEINSELSTLTNKLSGYSRAKVYGSNKYLVEAEKKDRDRVAELKQEKKTLERAGTFSASEMKQFEIDDAKEKLTQKRLKAASYGQRPSVDVAEEVRAAYSEQFKAQEELEALERQQELYGDISEFGDVVNKDGFVGQWKANYRSNELSREADKAMSRYISNPTEENRELAYAYDELAKQYAINNEKALDDENAKASWLTKSLAGYLPQFKDQIVPEVLGGIAGGAVGFWAGSPTKGAAIGAGLATGLQSYDVMRGSVYRTLLAEGVDEETALEAAKDEALISALIEGGETALSIGMAGGGKAVSAIGNAAKSSVAKGSTNWATKLVANLATKSGTKATTKAATKAVAEVSKPLWKKGLGVAFDIGKQGASEYVEEFTQGAVSKANREKALASIDKEIGRFGEGNIDLYDRPIYKNADGSISTVDSVTYEINGKYVVLPTIVRDENGKAKRLNTDEEILAHYEKTGEFLGVFDTLEDSNGYANKVHSAQAYYYSDKTVDSDDNLWSGGAKVIGDAVFGGNTDAFAELHEQGVEGFKIGVMMGGSRATVNNIITHYANAKTVKSQNEYVDAIIADEKSLDALVEEGKTSGKGTVSEKIATEIEAAKKNGKAVTRGQVKKLIESNEVYKKAETSATLEQTAREVVEKENSERASTVLGDGKKAVGIADGQAYVSDGNVFIPVKDVNVAKTEFGATESENVSKNVSKLLQSDFTSINDNPVEGNLEGVGTVRVFTDEKGREIAVKKEVAEYLDGYNLEATFRGGKPYAIKATDNDGNVTGVAMAVGMDRSGQKYNITSENPMLQERQAREAYIEKATGYGQYGVKAFADVMETISENEAPAVARLFQAAYEAGLTNVEMAEASLPTELHRIAFKAGKQDYIKENVGKVENVKNVKSHGGKAGLDSTNVPSSVSKRAIDIVDKFCKALGVKAQMVGKSDMFNANITPNVGVVQIASDFNVLEDLGEDAISLSFVRHALHEIADHRAEELAPTEYAEFKREMYKYRNSALGLSKADEQRQAYGKRGVDISLSEAMSEVTANSILELYDNDLDLLAEALDRVLNGTNAKAKKGANIFKQALDYVIEKFNKFLEKLGIETKKTYKPSVDEIIKIRDSLENTLRAAVAKNKELAKTNLVTEKDGTVVDAKGNVVAQINEDGTATFSLKTFDDTGRAELHKWLNNNIKNKKLTEAEAKEISEQLEYYYDVCKEYEDKYAPFSAWSKAEVVKGLDGKPLMSVVKENGDYSMNLDFSLVCKKRRPLDALYRAMIDDGFMDNIGQLSEVEVARINEIIRKNGFETACTLCFVDSKRYRQYAVADAFVSKYNELVKMLAPEGAKIDRFDFSGKRGASADGLHTMSDADLKKGIVKLNKVIKEHGETTVVGKIAKHLKAFPQDRKLVMVSDFMDSEGFVRVKKANPSVFKLYNSSKGSGGPKATLPDVQYLGEILKGRGFTAKKAYSVGGVRVQSFSDYIPRLVFDYLQMTADLSAKKLPAHAYSKEDIFVMQFGKTGIKINMSLVPAVAKDGIAPGLDKDGNYVWVDGHTFASDFHDKGSGQRGFELAVKIQNTEGYSNNCGTIAVGVSDEHIIKMLKDNDIRMVIPYHKSSLNHFVAKMGNIDQYKDYTNVQNTRDKATGKKIEGKDFNFNEAFHRLGDAKLATKEYLAWCEKNNYIPKFDTFAFHEDAEVRENYYKVLIDFAAYDSNGNATPQGAVTMNFPTENDAFGSMKSLIEKGLEADAILEGRKAENIPKILKEVKSALGTEGKKFSLKGTRADGIEVYETSEEVMNLTVNERKKRYVQLMSKEYAGRTARFVRNGHTYYAEFDRANLGKAMYGENRSSESGLKALTRVGADGDIFDLVENSTYSHSKLDTKSHKKTDYFDYFIKTVQIDNKVYDLLADVKKKYGENGGYVYTLVLKDNKKIKVAPTEVIKNDAFQGVETTLIAEQSVTSDKSSVDETIAQNTEFVKGEKNSLKGTEKDIPLKDIPKVRKAVADKRADVLAKYVDSGAISTDVYNQLLEDFGAIPVGENPSRDISVPKKTAKDKKVSQTVRTILEAEATPDVNVPTIQKMVEDGLFSYDVYTDKEAIENGEEYIKTHGWEQSLVDWFDAVNSGEVSKDTTTTGWILYNHAANSGDAKTSIMILDAMIRHQRNAAQALQATRILKKLSPEGQLYGVAKSVEALQKELTDKYGKKAPDLQIDEELAEQFLNAKTPEERAEVEKEIYKDIGRQMPSRFIDKWNAWRYLAMLGNLRTHGRNIVGNAGFAPVVMAKNLTATVIESVVHRVSGGKTVRGKALIWGSKADRTLLEAAWNDYANVADLVSNGGKYNDFAMASQQIEEGRQIFKFKPLEWARKGNSKALEAEDVWFSKPHYAYALAQYCKANNITAEQIKNGKAIAPAREYAIKEAQKATYKDTNAFSQMVSEWGRNKAEKNVVKKAFNTVVEGILPFRKTPANILVRGVEYSPLGLLKGLSYDLVQVGKGKMTATEAIDNISAGLTGTGLLALGAYLAAEGLIRGHGEDEEEEKKFKEMMGHQAYSLELPNGQSITLDWLAPEALPFFVGVNLWELSKGSDEEVNLSTILQSISYITEPMLEMSCLQGLNDLFEGIGYASSNDTSGLVSVVSSAVTSYLTQGLPTLGGQAERTSEEERMTTYTEKNDFFTGDMQYTLGKASAKIPFWDYNQIPYIDAWGRKEASGTALKRGLNNFLNPAYTSTIETSKTEKELLRLYEKTGEGGVFPERADKYFTVDGERKDLTAEEYVRYATLKGEKSLKAVTDLVNSRAYKKLTDEEKAKAIKDAYDYANQKAKKAISRYKPESWVETADEFGNVGNYLSFKTEINNAKNEKGKDFSKQDAIDIILDMAQSDSEIWKMYLSEYDAKKDVEAQKIGIKGEEYMTILKNMDKYDEPNKNGNLGTYTNDEISIAIDMTDGLTNREKAELWQSLTGSSSTKNNPWRGYLR